MTASAPGCSASPSSARCRSPARALAQVRGAYPGIDGTRLLYEAIRRLITWMIEDVVAETERRLAELAPRSAGDVRHAPSATVAFSPAMQGDLDRLARLSRDQRLPPSAHRRASCGMRDRWSATCSSATATTRRRSRPNGASRRRRAARRPMPAISADFIAGMTDRYALAEHRRLFDATPDLR